MVLRRDVIISLVFLEEDGSPFVVTNQTVRNVKSFDGATDDLKEHIFTLFVLRRPIELNDPLKF